MPLARKRRRIGRGLPCTCLDHQKEPIEPQEPESPGEPEVDEDDAQLEEPEDDAFGNEERDTANVSEIAGSAAMICDAMESRAGLMGRVLLMSCQLFDF